MNAELVAIVAKSGVWAVLFVSLLYYVLYDARRRETKYQNVIDKLSHQLDSVEEIKINLQDIKSNCKNNNTILKEKL